MVGTADDGEESSAVGLMIVIRRVFQQEHREQVNGSRKTLARPAVRSLVVIR